jgi:hypothetical protein
MNRRKTVSVTPAIGASTVAGAIFTGPINTWVGKEFMTNTTNLNGYQPETELRAGPSL